MEIAEKIGRSIRNGYVNRNPLTAEFYGELNQLAACVQRKDGTFQSFHSTNPGAPGFSIVGASGTGKTAAINRILMQIYPQKIMHTEYAGQQINHLQLVWMKLTCPHDGSVKGLCINFFKEFDVLTGDTTYQKFASSRASTVDTMLVQMALLAKRHSLGALIIDEIQNISFAKSGGKDRMLNFLANLMDTLGIPIIVIGTPSAIEALSGSFMNARRNTGQQGTVVMKILPYGTGDWNILIRQLWKYQWTNTPTELTVELSQIMNQASNGVVAIAVSLYAWVQQQAIFNGQHGRDEIITPALIQEVAQSDHFRLLQEQMTVMDTKDGKDNRKLIEKVQWSDARNAEWAEISLPKQKRTKKNISNICGDDTILKWDADPLNGVETLKNLGLLVWPEDPF